MEALVLASKRNCDSPTKPQSVVDAKARNVMQTNRIANHQGFSLFDRIAHKGTSIRVGLAADRNGQDLKRQLAIALKMAGHDVIDFGNFGGSTCILWPTQDEAKMKTAPMRSVGGNLQSTKRMS